MSPFLSMRFHYKIINISAMSSDLLKRLHFLTWNLVASSSAFFVYNLITFTTGRQYAELILFTIITALIVLVPIVRDIFDYNKWDITLAIANAYAILILYNNWLNFFSFSFAVISFAAVAIIGTIALRSRQLKSHEYSPANNELQFSVGQEDPVPLEEDKKVED